MIVRNVKLFPLFILVMFCSCKGKKTLLIKNVTESYDSLPIEIKVNGKTEVKDYEKRSSVSLEYSEKKINVDRDSICVDVSLPTLNITKTSCTSFEKGNIIVVTISEIFSDALFDSVMIANPSNQDMKLYKTPHLSIAFLKQKLDEVH